MQRTHLSSPLSSTPTAPRNGEGLGFYLGGLQKGPWGGPASRTRSESFSPPGCLLVPSNEGGREVGACPPGEGGDPVSSPAYKSAPGAGFHCGSLCSSPVVLCAGAILQSTTAPWPVEWPGRLLAYGHVSKPTAGFLNFSRGLSGGLRCHALPTPGEPGSPSSRLWKGVMQGRGPPPAALGPAGRGGKVTSSLPALGGAHDHGASPCRDPTVCRL